MTASNHISTYFLQEKSSSASIGGRTGECLVEGSLYPRTADGINAAIAACSPGTTHVTGGTYKNLSSSINIGCGQCMSKTASDQIVMPGPLFDTDLAKPKIGGGSILNGVYRGSDLAPDSPFTAIAPQSCQERSLKLPGSAKTGVAAVSPADSVGDVNPNWSAYVSAADAVTVRISNPSAVIVTPSLTFWNVLVVQ